MATIHPSHWIPERATIEITTSAHLDERPDVAFAIAGAPDGLPLAMHVVREVDVREPVLRALRHPPSPSPQLERALDMLDTAARAHSLGLGIVQAERRMFYETAQTMSSLLGRTLLARMVGSRSPMQMPESRHDAADDAPGARIPNTAVHAIRDLRGEAPDELPDVTAGRDARLWIGVEETTAHAVPIGREGATWEQRFAAARPVVFESLLALRSARWHISERTRLDRVEEGKLADRRAYVRALRDGGRLGWSVSRADAAQLVAELARAVDREWHARHRVHGDLKPDNVLLVEQGISAFDAIDVPDGETCAGVSEGWAAPEQVFVRPVSAATDVFSLALIAASAVSAVIYGEESAVVVPAAGQGRRRLRMIKDPEVWLDPAIVDLPTPARLAWRELLVRCLASDPVRRPQRGSELAGALDKLLSSWDVPGRLEVACGPGTLQHTVNGDVPMWVIGDRR